MIIIRACMLYQDFWKEQLAKDFTCSKDVTESLFTGNSEKFQKSLWIPN